MISLTLYQRATAQDLWSKIKVGRLCAMKPVHSAPVSWTERHFPFLLLCWWNRWNGCLCSNRIFCREQLCLADQLDKVWGVAVTNQVFQIYWMKVLTKMTRLSKIQAVLKHASWFWKNSIWASWHICWIKDTKNHRASFAMSCVQLSAASTAQRRCSGLSTAWLARRVKPKCSPLLMVPFLSPSTASKFILSLT